MTLSHSRIWAAIDQLATLHGLTASGLARRAGLDPTTFNRSKRTSAGGRRRWPSTESLAKILEATGADMDDFLALLRREQVQLRNRGAVPLIGFAQAGEGGFFDDAGFPSGQGWDEVEIPGSVSGSTFALKVSGSSMLPLYRHGDTIIVDRDVASRKGDRVVVKTRSGEVMAKVLQRRSSKLIELASLNPDHANRSLNLADVEWIGRIIWASQ